MNKIHLLFVLAIMCTFSLNAQDENTQIQTRNVFLETGIGFPNIVHVGLGFQLNEQWSIAVNGNLFNNKKRDPGIYFGSQTYGFRLAKHFNKDFLRFLNMVSLSAGYYQYNDSNGLLRKEGSTELCIGREDITSESINIGYQIGFATFVSSHFDPFFSPSIKVNLILNF
ncbi:MAG: hypothetical protein KKA84_04455 [Bacteroidetes bacterium]|nr:hypothetical protein [Bacteroidota bacterium]